MEKHEEEEEAWQVLNMEQFEKIIGFVVVVVTQMSESSEKQRNICLEEVDTSSTLGRRQGVIQDQLTRQRHDIGPHAVGSCAAGSRTFWSTIVVRRVGRCQEGSCDMVKMRALLVQQGCAVALEGKDKFPKDTKEEVKKEIMAKAHFAILLSVTDEVLREVVDQTASSELWDKLVDDVLIIVIVIICILIPKSNQVAIWLMNSDD
nr:retrovirus-related Pol polyprotein from transposon TNT 1-94 [Tanacetum cinerariifolium]